MPDILVRNVPEAVINSLKHRAAEHRRSLQQEVVSLLEMAVEEPAQPTPAQLAAMIRARLAETGRHFGDSGPLIREDLSDDLEARTSAGCERRDVDGVGRACLPFGSARHWLQRFPKEKP